MGTVYITFDSYDGITAYADTFEEAKGQVYNGWIEERKSGGRAWEVEEGKVFEVAYSARHF